jgi:hypothetical protein
MVNGNVYDFESLKLQLPTGKVILLESINWNDKKDDEVITGVNGLPVGIGRGEYSGECEIELGAYEYEQLNKYANDSGGFYNLPPVSIVAAYGHEGQDSITDKLSVHFTERDFSAAKGDTNLKVTVKGALTAVPTRNDVAAYKEE